MIFKYIIHHRTFGGGIPKFIRTNIPDEDYEKIKNKDVTIRCYIEIE